ncbi:transcriptional regulator [Enterobacterales bacterium CwR94]|nr:transcriptional regulator [Enterobacterales bacterium CwR94]
MQQNTSETELLAWFQSGGENLAAETEVLGAVIRHIVADRGYVTNKDIILTLIANMEVSTDEEQIELLRSTLELVVGRTPDDDGV